MPLQRQRKNTKRAKNISSIRMELSVVVSFWLANVFFRLRNGSSKTVMWRAGLYRLSTDTLCAGVGRAGWILSSVSDEFEMLIEGVWSTSSIYIMCRRPSDERRSEIEQAFEVVRGGQLHWFLACLLHFCRILKCPKLGGEWHLEAEEIRRGSGGFRPRRSWKLHA